MEPGATLDERYVLERPLGEGGQGSVWVALDRLTGHRRALKLIDLSRVSSQAAERARREARHLAALDHPAIVHCHGLFEDPRSHLLALVLEYVEGASLRTAQDDLRLTPAHRADVLRHVAEALAYCHARGVVHRDIKPQNVVVSETFFASPSQSGQVKLVDFGIAVPVGNPDPLTQADRTVGTRAYMAPEQLDPRTWGDRSDTPAVDVFAWGVMGWELLVGGHPAGLAPGATQIDLIDAYRAARSVGRLALPQTPWTPVLGATLALPPEQRVPDGAALLALLRGAPAPAPAPVYTDAASSAGSGGFDRGGQPMTRTETAAMRDVPVPVARSATRRPKWIVALTVAVVAVVGVLLVATKLAANPRWDAYVCDCCKESPRHTWMTLAQFGVPPTLAEDARWSIHLAFGTLSNGKYLHDAEPDAEVCVQPKGSAARCWPVARNAPPHPLEVTTRDLTTTGMQLWVQVPSGSRKRELDRFTVDYPQLQPAALCRGITYSRSTKGAVAQVVLWVDPVGADLEGCRR